MKRLIEPSLKAYMLHLLQFLQEKTADDETEQKNKAERHGGADHENQQIPRPVLKPLSNTGAPVGYPLVPVPRAHERELFRSSGRSCRSGCRTPHNVEILDYDDDFPIRKRFRSRKRSSGNRKQ